MRRFKTSILNEILFKGHGEFLLVFQTLAIYVDLQGRKSRDREIMYPAVPTHISMNHLFSSYVVQEFIGNL